MDQLVDIKVALVFTFFGPLAQLVEQRPFKAWVMGSNPVRLNSTIRSLPRLWYAP